MDFTLFESILQYLQENTFQWQNIFHGTYFECEKYILIIQITKIILKGTKKCSFVTPVSSFLAVFGIFMSFQNYNYDAFIEEIE